MQELYLIDILSCKKILVWGSDSHIILGTASSNGFYTSKADHITDIAPKWEPRLLLPLLTFWNNVFGAAELV